MKTRKTNRNLLKEIPASGTTSSGRAGFLFLRELQKILESRFLPIFLCLFLLAGCRMAVQFSTFFEPEESEALNSIAAQYGVKIDAQSRKKLLAEQEQNAAKIEKMYREKYGAPEEGMEDTDSLIFSMRYEKGTYGLTEEEKRFLYRAEILQSLLSTLSQDPSAIQIMASPDYLKSGEKSTLDVFSLTGAEKEKYRSVLDSLEKQAETLSKKGDGATLFPNRNGIHDNLYSLMKLLLIFSLFFLVLVFSFSMNQEFTSGTFPLVYSSRRGRSYWKFPALASASFGILGCVLFFAVPLCIYIFRTGYWNFWDASLCSCLSQQPAVPFASFTLGQYFFLSLSVCAFLLLLFSLLLFTVSFFARSSLGAIGSFAAIFVVFLIPTFFLPLWFSKVVSQCSPFSMLIRCGEWFCSLFQVQVEGQTLLFPYLPWQDGYTLLFWGIGLFLLFLGSRWYFLRRASL